ncbi:MAG: hypothetical protein J5759_04725 [Bacteroidales bacterium]|nr:hypothetical protein [Bacteroidales bacterium]
MILLFLVCFSLVNSVTFDSLAKIERYIQDNPVRALEQLKEIPVEEIKSPREKALHSLLYSMALDKNYVDLQTDSIIRYAVNYYSRTSDQYHKSLSYYYLGRIFENQESLKDALNTYIEAERFIPKDILPDYYVRLCFAKERIYVRQFSYDKAMQECEKAKDYSRDLDNPQFYVRNCLDAASLSLGLNDLDSTARELDSLYRWLVNKSIPVPAEYYYTLTCYYLHDSSSEKEDIAKAFDDYSDACIHECKAPNNLFAAEVMMRLQNYQEANNRFKAVSIDDSYSVKDSVYYYGIASQLYELSGDFKQYLAYHKEYDRLAEALHLSIHKNDIRYLEERYQKEKELAAQRRHSIYLLIAVLILCALLLTSIAIGVKKKKEHAIALNEARREYNFIQHLVEQGPGNPSDIQSILSTRLAALTPYFRGVHTKQLGRQDLAHLKHDNREMLRNIGLLYSLSFPGFIGVLVNKGLNAEEIGLCSLYASGFVTKELSGIIDSGSIYHINSSIRAKLGNALDGRTLPAWLREMFNVR